MTKKERIEKLSHIFRALGDPTRLGIMLELNDEAQAVSELQQKLQLPQPNVSRHLRILRDLNLVTADRQGKRVVYSLADGNEYPAFATLFNRCWSGKVMAGPLEVQVCE